MVGEKRGFAENEIRLRRGLWAANGSRDDDYSNVMDPFLARKSFVNVVTIDVILTKLIRVFFQFIQKKVIAEICL